jgi:hypothetical protein
MTNRMTTALAGLMLLAPSVCADTLTLRSNAEINGQVQYDNNAFTITARYRESERTMKFDRKEILTLEINSRDFNPGEPPMNITMFDSRNTGTKDAGHPVHASGNPNKEQTAEEKLSSKPKRSVIAPDDYDRMTTDVVLLQDKTKLIGRIARLQKGYLTIQNGSENKEVVTEKVAIVFLAPE